MLTTLALAVLAAAPAAGDEQAALLAGARARDALRASHSAEVEVQGYSQFRYTLNTRDDPAGGDEDTTLGFHAPRTKANLLARIDDRWSAFIQGGYASSGGAFTLDDAVLSHRDDDNGTFKLGQFRLALLREESVLDSKQLLADRSAMNSVFNQGRSQAVQYGHAGDSWRWSAAFSDGIRTANTDFNSSAEADYAFTGRVEFKSGGNWAIYDDFTSFRDGETGLLLGAAAHWQSGGETSGTLDQDLFMLTADASYESAGWNAFGAFVWRRVDPSGSSPETDDLGLIAQAGVFVSESWELFARYDLTLADEDGLEDLSVVGVGANCYIIPESHAAKFTLEAQLALDPLTPGLVSSSTSVGLLADTGDPQVAIRAQIQLAW